jgi:hypothetical protein
MSAADRHALRQEHALPWLNEIHAECVKLRPQVLPKSATGQAVAYTLHMWPKLRRVFNHGEVALSTNVAENSMRPVALGRKNWLHVGSPKAGPKVAAILSVVEWCKRVRDVFMQPARQCQQHGKGVVGNRGTLHDLAIGEWHVTFYEVRPERVGLHAGTDGLLPLQLLRRREVLLCDSANYCMGAAHLAREFGRRLR